MNALDLAIVTSTLLFSSPNRAPDAFATAVPKDSQQFYVWSGSTGDLTVKLWLVQNGDSVYARGSYQVAATKKVGCGGETLPDKGLVTMRAGGSLSHFAGKLLFDSGWTPPFRASRTSPTSMSGRISSVDRGPCRLTLHRIPTTRRGPPRL